jgi:putative ABC transport system permease protein
MMRKLLFRLRALFRRKSMQGALEEEVQSHLRMAAQERMAQGESAEQARIAALREFGNVGLVKEVTRDTWGWGWLETFLRDLHYGVRQLGRNPGFTTIAVLTLALGIGANTAMFSVVNTILLHPLPYKNPDQLVRLFSTEGKLRNVLLSGPDFLQVKAQNQTFQQVGTFLEGVVNFTGQDEPERLRAAWVSSELFPLLRVQPIAGRTFLADEERPDRCQVAILSHAVCQRRFGSDRAALGKHITLDGKVYTVVGVMPAGFGFPNYSTEVWLPRTITAEDLNPPSRGLRVIARLNEGVELRQAQAELDTIAARLEREHPASDKGWSLEVVSFRESVAANTRLSLLILFGAVGFVLLIACANVANLSLARGAARQREVGVRIALGASRGRVVRQLLTESLALAFAGGTVGFIVALGGIGLLRAMAPKDVPHLAEASVDRWVLAFTLGASVLSSILFGLFPAFQISKPDPGTSLKEGAQTGFTSPWRHRTRDLLVISEVGLALVLLVGSGLMVQSFAQLVSVRPGFDPSRVLTMELSLPETKYPRRSERASAFVNEVLERVNGLPGVKSAAVTSEMLLGDANSADFSIAGYAPPVSRENPHAVFRFVSPAYFKTLSIPLIRGRDFTGADNLHSPCVAIVNEAAGERFWRNADPLRTNIDVAWRVPTKLCEVVGLAGNTRDLQLSAVPEPEIYLPYGQLPTSDFFLAVHTTLNPLDLASSVRREVWAVDKDQPIADITTMDAVVSTSVAEPRYRTLLLGSFAASALALAIVGIFGVTSYTMAQRTHEIGIRMALGAERHDVLRLVIGQGMRLTVIGVGVGLLAALGLTRLLASFLYAVRPTDPMTFVVVSAVMLAVALLASYIPARRATRVDPLVALRYE